MDLAIFLDYCSLFQEPRSMLEDEAHSKHGMKTMFAHMFVETPSQNDIDMDIKHYHNSKGNPFFERIVLDTRIMFIFQGNIMSLVMSKTC